MSNFTYRIQIPFAVDWVVGGVYKNQTVEPLTDLHQIYNRPNKE